MNVARKIWGYNCFYWFIVGENELFDVDQPNESVNAETAFPGS